MALPVGAMSGAAPRFALIGLATALLLLPSRSAPAQDLGHKALGTVGLDAGRQEEPGLYLADRLLYFFASEVKSRDGEPLPVQGLDLGVLANVIAVSATLKLRRLPYLSAAVGVPLAHVSLSSDVPQAAIDRLGVGDVFVQPLKVGWRFTFFDLVASYAFYAPTGAFEPREGGSLGRGHWTHQLSLGGAVYLGSTRRWRGSLLLSYDFNQQKRGIDITRGDTLQLQGGAGAVLFQLLEVGVAGYALWQVRDDRGADLPEALRGARTRVYGLGPEVGLVVPRLRVRFGLRYEWDFGTRARPEGQIFVFTVAFRAWSFDPPPS